MGLFHKHKWRCISWGCRNESYLSDPYTWINIYCTSCGKTKSKNIANFCMKQEDINEYVKNVYGQDD